MPRKRKHPASFEESSRPPFAKRFAGARNAVNRPPRPNAAKRPTKPTALATQVLRIKSVDEYLSKYSHRPADEVFQRGLVNTMVPRDNNFLGIYKQIRADFMRAMGNKLGNFELHLFGSTVNGLAFWGEFYEILNINMITRWEVPEGLRTKASRWAEFRLGNSNSFRVRIRKYGKLLLCKT